MRPRYLIYRTRGRRQAVLESVKRIVSDYQLGRQVPLVKFERGRGSEFYLGVGIVTDDLHARAAPPEIVQAMRDSLGSPLTQDLIKGAEIAGFMTGSLDWESFNRQIEFEPGETVEIRDLLDDGQDVRGLGDGDFEGRSEQLDKLLWWGSARGTGSLASFEEAGMALGAFEEKESAWSVLRRLVLLGHLEIDENSSLLSWGSVPPALVQSDCDENTYFLSGAITHRTIQRLSHLGELQSRVCPGIPTRFRVTADIAGECKASGEIAVIDGAARELATKMPALSRWKESLRRDPSIELHWFNFQRYDGRRFQSVAPDKVDPGFYLVEHVERSTGPRHVFFDGETWLAGKFYDLRFLDYIETRGAIAYGWSENTLLVPQESRLPMLYERCLVIASGKLPWIAEDDLGRRVLVYRGISSELSETICEKLSVDLEEGVINV